jgi:bacillithiol synthase
MPMQIPYHLIAGANRLACDYVENFSRLSDFFAGNPQHDEALSLVMEGIEKRDYKRDALAEYLLARNSSWGCSDVTVENIRKLRSPRSFAVTTGQQLGLFGGPLYTLYKGITAIRLAEELERRLNKPFVPVFWMESEDHDLLEATEIKILDRQNDIKVLRYEPQNAGEGLPLSSLLIDEGAGPLLDELVEAAPQSVFKDAMVRMMGTFFSPGALYQDACARWLMSLLGSHGLVIVLPGDPVPKKRAADLFVRELESAPRSSDVLAATSEELLRRGYHDQIKAKRDRVNLFSHQPGRRPLFLREGSFHTEPDSGAMSLDEMRELVKAHPERFSPNVALRPLVQDYILPTAIYVGGPGEIAYWAQLGGLYRLFEMVQPLVVPRMSVTLCEPRVRKTLEKFSLSYHELFEEREGIIRKKIENELPSHLMEALGGGWKGMKVFIDDLEQEAVSLDNNLKPLFRRSSGKIMQQWENLVRRVKEAYLQRDTELQKQAKRIEHSFFPDGELQERALGSIGFCLKYGEGLIDELFRAPEINPPWTHQIIEL